MYCIILYGLTIITCECKTNPSFILFTFLVYSRINIRVHYNVLCVLYSLFPIRQEKMVTQLSVFFFFFTMSTVFMKYSFLGISSRITTEISNLAVFSNIYATLFYICLFYVLFQYMGASMVLAPATVTYATVNQQDMFNI